MGGQPLGENRKRGERPESSLFDVPFSHSLAIRLSFPVGAGVVALIVVVYVVSAVKTPSVNYEGRHVMITGGSQGIGFEAAKEYLKRGANVTIVARKPEAALRQLEALRSSDSQQLNYVAVDISSGLEQVQAAFDPILKQVGDVHTIVNSAGISEAREFDKISQSGFERLLQVNVLGTIYATRAVLGGMKRNRGGRIVFVSSQVAHCAIYGYSAYAASKWALRGLAEALQMEVRPYDIYVSVSYPPDTDTPGYKNEMTDKPQLTKMLSESGVFQPTDVAMDIVNYSSKGYFAISHGFDGWLLKLLHPGMSPVNNIWEVTQQILGCAVARIITLFYLVPWDNMIAKEVNKVSSSSAASVKTGAEIASIEKEKTKSKKV